MAKKKKRFAKKAGLPPGTLVHLGEHSTRDVHVSIVTYDAETIVRNRESGPIDFITLRRESDEKVPHQVTWITVDGLHQTDLIEKIGKAYHIHPLVLEDIVSGEQRPKVEDFGAYLYIVVRAFRYNEETEEVDSEQVSFVLFDHTVLTFRERESDLFEPILERLKGSQGRIRKLGADYLAYTLLDVMIDDYFVVLEKVGERIEVLEDRLVEEAGTESLKQLHHFKRNMIFFRRSIWPLRDVISALERSEFPLITEGTRTYFRDLNDHTVRIVDMVETFRDMLGTMLDLYLSSASHRNTQVMNVLTIVATIFIPATFITSFYGMNFEYMPELHWKLGYPAVILLMIAVSTFLVLFFKKKRWI